MNADQLQAFLLKINACEAALKWCEGKSLDQAFRVGANDISLDGANAAPVDDTFTPDIK